MTPTYQRFPLSMEVEWAVVYSKDAYFIFYAVESDSFAAFAFSFPSSLPYDTPQSE